MFWVIEAAADQVGRVRSPAPWCQRVEGNARRLRRHGFGARKSWRPPDSRHVEARSSITWTVESADGASADYQKLQSVLLTRTVSCCGGDRIGIGACPHLRMPPNCAIAITGEGCRTGNEKKRASTQKKGPKAKNAAEKPGSARGNGGPDVYDVSKSLRRDNDLRFRLAWQGHG